MIRSTRAIVRDYIPRCDALIPGDIVHVSPLAFESGFGSSFPAIREADPCLMLRLDPIYLLPYREFLQRIPVDIFYILIPGRNLGKEIPELFLSRPNEEFFGPLPFRFESLGEAVHYLHHHAMPQRKFKIAKVLDLNVCR